MQATAISRRNSRTRTTLVRVPVTGIMGVRSQAVAERRKIRRCPAVRLAASRRARAMGWARRLRASIQTIRGIRNPGVPWGTRWLRR